MNFNGIVMPSRIILKLLAWMEWRMESPWHEQNKIADTRIKIYTFRLFFLPSLLLLSQLKLWNKIFFKHVDTTVKIPRPFELVQFVQLLEFRFNFSHGSELSNVVAFWLFSVLWFAHIKRRPNLKIWLLCDCPLLIVIGPNNWLPTADWAICGRINTLFESIHINSH